MKVFAEKNWAALGRRFARMALKKFFANKEKYLDNCGCNEFSTDLSCLECLVNQVENIVQDMLHKEAVTPNSKMELPERDLDIEEVLSAARELAQRSIKRTLDSGSMFYRSSGEALITNLTEAFEAGQTAGQDAIREAWKSAPDSQPELLREEALRLAEQYSSRIHPMIKEYFDQGVQEAVDQQLLNWRPVSTEKITTSKKEYRVARYQKKQNNC